MILFDIWWGYSPKICLQRVGFQREMRRPRAPLRDYPLPCILIRCHASGVVMVVGDGSGRAEGGLRARVLRSVGWLVGGDRAAVEVP